MVDEGGGGGSECPACGITVATGYPRCPKCHAAMPSVATRARSADRGVHAGGTSVGGGADPTNWLVPIVGLVVVSGIAIFVLMRSDKPAAEAPVPNKVTDSRPATEVVEEPVFVADEAVGEAVVDDSLRHSTAVTVASALDGARLWAKVAVDGDVLVISSAYCENPGTKQVIAANQAAIMAAEFAKVRCLERHGALVFEDSVTGAGDGEGGAGAVE